MTGDRAWTVARPASVTTTTTTTRLQHKKKVLVFYRTLRARLTDNTDLYSKSQRLTSDSQPNTEWAGLVMWNIGYMRIILRQELGIEKLIQLWVSFHVHRFLYHSVVPLPSVFFMIKSMFIKFVPYKSRFRFRLYVPCSWETEEASLHNTSLMTNYREL